MWIDNFWENWTNKSKLLNNSLDVHDDVFSEIWEKKQQFSNIIPYRWDICPSCDSSNYENDRCQDCWYGFWFYLDFSDTEEKLKEKEFEEQRIKEEQEKINNKFEEEKIKEEQEKKEKEQQNIIPKIPECKYLIWEKVELITMFWKVFNYFYYPNKVKNWKWVFEIEYKWKKYIIKWSFSKHTNTHFQDSENVCTYLKIDLDIQSNRWWNYYVLDLETKKWVFFEYKLAKNIIQAIVEKFYSWQ